MAFIKSKEVAEALWEEGNIQKRFNTTLEELIKVMSNASDKQKNAMYNYWQKSANFHLYQILKTLKLKIREKALIEGK